MTSALDSKAVSAWLAAYGAAWIKGDPDAIVALFTSDAVYRETPFDPPMEGSGAIKTYWQEGASDGQADVSFDFDLWAVQDLEAHAGWTAGFTRKATGSKVELDGTFRLSFELTDEGLKCNYLSEWWHRKEMPKSQQVEIDAQSTGYWTRRAAPDDLVQLLDMIQGLAVFHGDNATVTIDDLDRDLFGSDPWSSAVVAVQGDDALVGYTILCPTAKMQFGSRGMDIHHLFVKEESRGKGVGELLIQTSLDMARQRGCGYVTVGAHPKNERAQAFYRRVGFNENQISGPKYQIKLVQT